MSERVRWGIAVPQGFIDGPVDMALVQRWTQRAEALDFESLWTLETILSDFPVLEPVTLLSYMSAITERVRLGTSVMVAPHRNPVQLAKALGSLDNMSGGRLIVGIGLGLGLENFAPFGINSEKRVRRFVEIMDVMKALWTETEARYAGQFWQLEGTPMEPKPVQKPYPPIWLGGGHPDALRRAVRHADGWMGAGASSTAEFKANMGFVRAYLEEADRDPATLDVSKRVYLAIDNDEDRAETRLRRWFVRFYKDADLASRVAVWGSVSRCTEKLAEISEAGAQMLMVNPVYDHMEHLEAISQEIVPNL